MDNKLISIIVPVYNVEKYIARCIESIIFQTYTYWELILVDDGSSDNSGKIGDEYAGMDSRIQVIHTPNRGRSLARNTGLKHATGEWISFVDSDDYVGRDYLDVMIQSNPEWNVDLLVTQGFIGVKANGELDNSYLAAIYKDWKFKAGEAQDIIQSHSLLHRQAVWGRLFNAAKIREAGIEFNSHVSHSEDAIFLHRYMLLINNYSFITAREYFYITPAAQKSTEKIDYDEMLELAQVYSNLSFLLIRHFQLEKFDYANRIIDMFQSRYAKLVLDKHCPSELKTKAKQIDHSILWHRKIHKFADFKLMIKYLLA